MIFFILLLTLFPNIAVTSRIVFPNEFVTRISLPSTLPSRTTSTNKQSQPPPPPPPTTSETPESESGGSGESTIIKVCIGAGIAIVLWVGIIVCCCAKSKKKGKGKIMENYGMESTESHGMQYENEIYGPGHYYANDDEAYENM